jgi:type IV pilus assembly protein PilM
MFKDYTWSLTGLLSKSKQILTAIIPEKFKLGKKQEVMIGLDIGSSSIKAVVLELKEQQFSLKNFSLIEMPPQGADLSSSIKKALSSLEVRSPIVNVSLSGQPVIIRYAWLPKMTERELTSSLHFEAAKLIPFAVSEVNVDSCILKQDASNNKMLVLIVAAKKEAVSERITLLKNAGINLGIIDVDSLALINAFNLSHAAEKNKDLPKAFALLNVGASVSNLNILEAGIPVFSRDIYIGGNSLSKKISDFLGVDLKAAEARKINPDKDQQEGVMPAVEPVLSSLASEIRISFDYYESQGASSVEKIFLSGGGSLLYNFKDNLTRILGIDSDYWNPLSQVEFAAGYDAEAIKSCAAKFAVALGLAMRR